MGCNCNNKSSNTQENNSQQNKRSSIMNVAGSTGHVVMSDDDPLYIKRIEICSSCPLIDTKQFQCKACGCFMRLKAKLQHEKCPLENPKW